MSEATDIKKNATEIVRIEANSFRGREMIDVRVWYEAEPGVHRPTNKGLCLRPQTWQEVLDSVKTLLADVGTN